MRERKSAAIGRADPSAVSVSAISKRLISLLWPKGEKGLKVRVVAALSLILVGKLISVTVPFLYKEIVDGLSSPLVFAPIALILAYGLAELSNQLTGELRQFLFVSVGQRAIRITSLEVFRKLHGLSLNFHLNRKTGGLTTIIARGTTGLEFLLELVVFNILPTLIELALVAAILFSLYDPAFALITIVTVILYLSFTFVMTQWQLQFRREMNALDVGASMKAVDSLLNFETVKYFGAEKREADRFDVAKRAYAVAAIRNQTTQIAMNAGRVLIITAGSVAVMLLAGRQVVSGTMTIGDFVLVNAYLLQLYAPLAALGVVYSQIKQSVTDVDAMLTLLSTKSDVEDERDATELRVSSGRVEFDAIEFGYDERRPILEGVSFSIPAGKTVAVVGTSGAGKSTLARLLFRFYDVNGGVVKIDGQDIRDVSQESLRAAIGVVPQDCVLFHDTIFYNIAYGIGNATREDVVRAAKIAQLHDFIERLPDGYETQVGERGLKLSGGEKQRVAIARVALKNPPILIFDEATSALDTHTEQEILSSLAKVSINRSALVIAHRLSTIIHAHEICVLHDGLVIERGTHNMLLAKKGRYAEMWLRQQKKENLERGTAVEDVA